MKEKKKSYPPIHMGISLMLVIFIILSMVIFSILSLSTAIKDYNYSKKNAEKTTAYYNACNLAEEELAKYNKSIMNYETNQQVEFQTYVDDSNALYVVLEAHPEQNQFVVKTWKIISTKTWEGNDTLPILGSERNGE